MFKIKYTGNYILGVLTGASAADLSCLGSVDGTKYNTITIDD